MNEKKESENLTPSQAFTELEETTREFEQGEIDLEKGVVRFKRGLKLAQFLKEQLSQIENEIKEIKDDFAELEMPTSASNSTSQGKIEEDVPVEKQKSNDDDNYPF